jgi:hypothetical protein
MTRLGGWDRDETNRWILYHGKIARALTSTRTALESALIPVTAYILVSGIECYRRHPEMMREIAAAMPPEEIGAAGRRPGNQVDSVHLWSIANIYLVGRQVLAPFGMITPARDLDDTATVLDFWKRAAASWRADGHLQAWDAGGVVRPYDDAIVDELVAGCEPVGDDTTRAGIRKLNASLTSYLFLYYFDTRAGYQDTGPYDLGDGRVLLVRDFSEFAFGHFPWSAAVAGDLPYSNLTAAFVLDDVSLQVTDWGTSITEPDDYLGRLRAFGLFTPHPDGKLERVPLDGLDELAAAVKTAQRRCYRLIAGMARNERIDAGAYVYFTFLRPFAEAAGIADRLDWTVPRDSLDLYDGIATLDKMPDVAADETIPYYTPIPEPPIPQRPIAQRPIAQRKASP